MSTIRRSRPKPPPRSGAPRVFALLVLLAIVAGGTWYVLSRQRTAPTQYLSVYYTKQSDGTSLGTWPVSTRPAQSGETGAEHLHNQALYAAVQAVAGPPSDVAAVRFPPGTHVQSVSVTGSTATVDLSKDVAQQVAGTFGENGEFKSLVYTVTGVPGINAVQVTVNGATLETLPGGHVELDQPLHRSDF
jgi:spore germination protein GerM